MKIQEDLMGFVDLGDMNLNYATVLATHILVFLVKSVVNPLPQSFATFATTGITSYQIFSLIWKAVNILENMK